MTVTGLWTGYPRSVLAPFGNVAGSDASINATTNNAVTVMCFAGGTLMTAQSGTQVPVEALRAGDRLRRMDRGGQVLRWIGRRDLGAEDLAGNPALRPIGCARGRWGMACRGAT